MTFHIKGPSTTNLDGNQLDSTPTHETFNKMMFNHQFNNDESVYDVSPLYKADLRQLEMELLEDANRIFTTTLHNTDSETKIIVNPDFEQTTMLKSQQ